MGVCGCHGNLHILSIFVVRLPKLAVEAPRVVITSSGSRCVLNLLFLGVRGCQGDLRILSILAVRLPKLAVFGCSWVSVGVTAIYVFCRYWL